MFERVMDRAVRHAEARARIKRAELAERMRAEVQRGIAVAVGDEGVRLSGRGLRRRFLLDPALRWLTGRLR